MRRPALIFLAAILFPSLLLAWLAVRSARDQQFVLERQQAIISQGIVDSLAEKVRLQMDGTRDAFVQVTDELLRRDAPPSTLAADFDRKLRATWDLAEVGFAATLKGDILSPSRDDGPAARVFRDENDRFLSNRENAEVFPSLALQSKLQYSQTLASKTIENPEQNDVKGQAAGATSLAKESEVNAPPSAPNNAPAAQAASGFAKSSATKDVHRESPAGTASLGGATPDSPTSAPTEMTDASYAVPANDKQFKVAGKTAPRLVTPQQNFNSQAVTLSNTVPEESGFLRLIGHDTTGALARFLENKLRLIVWYRPPGVADFVFGAQLNQSRLVTSLRPLLDQPPGPTAGSSAIPSENNYCLALLDDMGHPVILSHPGFTADWKHPFVATEIGETLPHWEAALYLVNPRQITESARTLRLTLGLIVVVLVVAIAAGGSLIAADIRRQMRLARQKTDFVSNVSHELKTPLTSIRMFADLLAEGRVSDPSKQNTYLRIIAAESARLTRLINNVLDFARIERGAPIGERRPCDLAQAALDVAETCRPHLEAAEIAFQLELEADSLPASGDRDALAQIVLNLISNAEKYGSGEILVRIRRQQTSAGAVGCVDVLDRGPGVPAAQAETIFQPFRRLDDSLASGVPGSGLGLTLARRMARAHGGDVTCSPRAGGGSCFTLSIPLDEKTATP